MCNSSPQFHVHLPHFFLCAILLLLLLLILILLSPTVQYSCAILLVNQIVYFYLSFPLVYCSLLLSFCCCLFYFIVFIVHRIVTFSSGLIKFYPILSYISRWTFPLVMSLDGSHMAIVKGLAMANHTHTWRGNMSPLTSKDLPFNYLY